MTDHYATDELARQVRYRLDRLAARAVRMDAATLEDIMRHLDAVRDAAQERRAARGLGRDE